MALSRKTQSASDMEGDLRDQLVQFPDFSDGASEADSIFKSRDITLPTKGRIVKATVFPAVMYGCESCTIKKAKH